MGKSRPWDPQGVISAGVKDSKRGSVAGLACSGQVAPHVGARTTDSDTVIWQPEPGLRMAVVARPAAGKVIVAGRSLTFYEDRDRMFLVFLAAGWLGSMVVLAAGYAATGLLSRRRRDRTTEE